MPLMEKQLLVVFVGLAVFYILYRVLFSAGRPERLYQENVDKILNSEEYKVKGRFE